MYQYQHQYQYQIGTAPTLTHAGMGVDGTMNDGQGTMKVKKTKRKVSKKRVNERKSGWWSG